MPANRTRPRNAIRVLAGGRRNIVLAARRNCCLESAVERAGTRPHAILPILQGGAAAGMPEVLCHEPGPTLRACPERAFAVDRHECIAVVAPIVLESAFSHTASGLSVKLGIFSTQFGEKAARPRPEGNLGRCTVKRRNNKGLRGETARVSHSAAGPEAWSPLAIRVERRTRLELSRFARMNEL